MLHLVDYVNMFILSYSFHTAIHHKMVRKSASKDVASFNNRRAYQKRRLKRGLTLRQEVKLDLKLHTPKRPLSARQNDDDKEVIIQIVLFLDAKLIKNKETGVIWVVAILTMQALVIYPLFRSCSWF